MMGQRIASFARGMTSTIAQVKLQPCMHHTCVCMSCHSILNSTAKWLGTQMHTYQASSTAVLPVLHTPARRSFLCCVPSLHACTECIQPCENINNRSVHQPWCKQHGTALAHRQRTPAQHTLHMSALTKMLQVQALWCAQYKHAVAKQASYLTLAWTAT